MLTGSIFNALGIRCDDFGCTVRLSALKYIIKVPDALYPGSVLLPEVLKVLLRGPVLRVGHLDGPGIHQLWGQVLYLYRNKSGVKLCWLYIQKIYQLTHDWAYL